MSLFFLHVLEKNANRNVQNTNDPILKKNTLINKIYLKGAALSENIKENDFFGNEKLSYVFEIFSAFYYTIIPEQTILFLFFCKFPKWWRCKIS